MLTAGEMEDLRERIRSELAGIAQALDGAEHGRGAVELDQTRVGRLSRMDAIQQQAMAAGTAERLQRERRRLEAALGRFDADRYGRCCQCGEEIVPGRLHADPAAPFCADCQAEIDERRAG